MPAFGSGGLFRRPGEHGIHRAIDAARGGISRARRAADFGNVGIAGMHQVGALSAGSAGSSRAAVDQARMRRGNYDTPAAGASTKSSASASSARCIGRTRPLRPAIAWRLAVSVVRNSRGNVPGEAISASASLSKPRWIASSGRWKSMVSQFATSLTLGLRVVGIQIVEGSLPEDDGGRDIVFHLHFIGRVEIGAELVDAPGAIGIVAHAQVIAHQLLIFELQFVPGQAVDMVHAEVLAPVVAPLGLVIALDGDRIGGRSAELAAIHALCCPCTRAKASRA